MARTYAILTERDVDLLTVSNLYKHYPLNGKRVVCAVNGVSFSIKQGETFGLVGESGCGKSTVGRLIAGLIEPTGGTIAFGGTNLVSLSGEKRRQLPRDIQIVFQDPYGSLNPRKKVNAIVEETMMLLGESDKAARRRRVVEVLKLVELDESCLDKYPIQLTQGEQQRIGVARAFVTRPKLVVLDEPTSLLDIRFRGEIVRLLKRLQQETGCSYLFISHDLNIVHQISHQVGVMYLGRMVEQGAADRIFHEPQHPYTQALLNATLFPDPNRKREKFHLEGEAPSPVNLSDRRCNFGPRCAFESDRCQAFLPVLTPLNGHHAVACFHPQSDRSVK